jgi:hypothetical protein
VDAFALLAATAPADGIDCPYAPLIGSWDIASRWFEPDGSTREARGEWHFAWILGGRGVLDVLFARGAPAGERGTSIRCYDAALGAWRVVWMQPAGGEFVILTARADAGVIVQEGQAMDGSSRQRWAFSEMTADAFSWRGESSRDEGRSWRTDQEMTATPRR